MKFQIVEFRLTVLREALSFNASFSGELMKSRTGIGLSLLMLLIVAAAMRPTEARL